MLDQARAVLPDILLVRASALALPFGDRSLAAVNCWNALQVLPAPDQVIAEVGRCLRPGGSLTVFTFRPSPSPIQACFAHRHAPRSTSRRSTSATSSSGSTLPPCT
jgi:ubiquinone/menaquinone biosynthesis C-methylase UbiE